MQDILADFMAWFSSTFALFAHPPYSPFFIAFFSIIVSTLSNLATKKFTDVRRLRRYQTEVKQYQEMQKEAEKTQNEKLLRKVKRRKAYIERIQREMLTQRCKPSLIFFGPFVILFTILRAFYLNNVVAIVPLSIHKVLPFLVPLAGYPTAAGFGMTFFAFYMLVGLGFGQILQRLMGVSIT